MNRIITKQLGLQAKAAGERRMTFIISTGDEDRSGDTISPQGWVLDAYRRNPVVAFAHQYTAPPIGKAVSIGVDGQALVSTVEFPQPGTYELADVVHNLAQQGFLNAASVGFRPLQWEPVQREDGRRGIAYTRQELVEWSVVPVPDNPHALRVASLMKGGVMRYDEELIDIDEAMLAETVREVVQGMLMQVTGQLDPAGRRYAVTPHGRVPLGARSTTPARSEDVLELRDETPAERHRRQEREAGLIFRTVDNSVAASLPGR